MTYKNKGGTVFLTHSGYAALQLHAVLLTINEKTNKNYMLSAYNASQHDVSQQVRQLT